MLWNGHFISLCFPFPAVAPFSFQGASHTAQLPAGMTLTLPHTPAPAEWDLKQRVRGHVSSAPVNGTAHHHCFPSVALSPSPARQPVCPSEPKETPMADADPCSAVPGAGSTGSPEPIQQEPGQGSIPKPQTSSRSQAVSKWPQSPLTILQGPLDVPCALADGVEVPIQSGDEEQRFWDSHSTAFEALGQTHHPQGLSQTREQSPSPGALCSSAPGAAAPSVTGTSCTAHIPPEPSWGWGSLPSLSSPWSEFSHRWDELQCGCSQSQPWMLF